MIDFYFDCSSPWTYLGFHNVQPMAAEIGEAIAWKPVLVGGVFNAVNPAVYARRDNPVPAKRNYIFKDLQDWAQLAGLKIIMPPKVFPINSVKAMRGCLWLNDQNRMVPFAAAVFEAYWSHEEDISNDAVLSAICKRCGIDAAQFHAAISQQYIKDRLRANTDELIQRGGFGSPTLYIGDDMYFGNDRLQLVRGAVLRARENQKQNQPLAAG